MPEDIPSRPRRRELGGAAALLGSLAGCVGVIAEPPANSGSETPPPTTTYSEDVTPYRDLSDEGQQVFQKLLDEGPATGARSDFPSQLWQAASIGYDGTAYAINRTQTHRYISEYTLDTNFVNESTIENESAVITFEQLSPEAQDAFETARHERMYKTRERLPDQLDEYEYVKYQNDHYKLEKAVGDIPEWELAASSSPESPTTTSGVANRYAFGEWHTAERWNGSWQFTIVSLSISTTYETDDNTTHQMPTDQQLLVAKAKIKNPSATAKRIGTSMDPTPFAAINGEDVYSEQYRIDAIEAHRLEQVSYAELSRYTSEGQEVHGGETADAAIVCTIPRGLSESDLEIGYDGENDTVQYPIRWTPK